MEKDEIRKQKRIEELKANKKVQRILEYRKLGLSHADISKMDDIKLVSTRVGKYIKECFELGITTQEEKNESERNKLEVTRQKKIKKLQNNKKLQRILEYRKLGMNYAEIAKMPDVNIVPSQVSEYMKECLELGIITQEEAESAKEKENEIKKQKRIRLLRSNEKVQRILEYKKQGLSNIKISKKEDVQISSSNVFEYLKECLELGIISQEEIPTKIKEKNTPKVEEKDLRRLRELRRNIENEVKFYKKISETNKDKVREYIELSFKINTEEPKSLLELEFIERAMQKIPTTYNDIIKYIRECNKSKLYEQALKMIRQTETMPELTIMPEEREKLNEVQPAIIRINKVQNTIDMIKKGNLNSEAISEITGLSKEEINFLKLKMLGKKPHFLDEEKREKLIRSIIRTKRFKQTTS